MKYLDKVYFAILKINPNAKYSILGENLDNINWVDTTPIPVADIETQIPIVEAEIEQKKLDAIAKKASGKQKLLDLGLSEEEVKALIGV